jgi:hypothetical protein
MRLFAFQTEGNPNTGLRFTTRSDDLARVKSAIFEVRAAFRLQRGYQVGHVAGGATVECGAGNAALHGSGALARLAARHSRWRYAARNDY